VQQILDSTSFHPGDDADRHRPAICNNLQHGSPLLDRIINRAFGFLVKLGLGLSHNFLLEVRGRKSGRIYSTPVNVLDYHDKEYLVAPRGDTQWVRNVIVSREATLVKGTKREKVRLRPIADEAKAEILKGLPRSLQAHRSAILSSPRGFAYRSV
jgi:deazaflavin-dependent oxidoreductase (nitroreductase family)